MITIHYKTKKLRKICENAEAAVKTYGLQMAAKIHQRIDEISSADSVEELVQYRIGRCHPLTGKREGQYAMDLTPHTDWYLPKKMISQFLYVLKKLLIIIERSE